MNMGKLKVYTDPLFPKDQVLMGYKGGSTLSTGFFFAPDRPRTEIGELAILVSQIFVEAGYTVADVNNYLYIQHNNLLIAIMYSDDLYLNIREVNASQYTIYLGADPEFDPRELLPIVNGWAAKYGRS